MPLALLKLELLRSVLMSIGMCCYRLVIRDVLRLLRKERNDAVRTLFEMPDFGSMLFGLSLTGRIGASEEESASPSEARPQVQGCDFRSSSRRALRMCQNRSPIWKLSPTHFVPPPLVPTEPGCTPFACVDEDESARETSVPLAEMRRHGSRCSEA